MKEPKLVTRRDAEGYPLYEPEGVEALIKSLRTEIEDHRAYVKRLLNMSSFVERKLKSDRESLRTELEQAKLDVQEARSLASEIGDENKQLRQDRNQLYKDVEAAQHATDMVRVNEIALTKELDRLREALDPFAEFAHEYIDKSRGTPKSGPIYSVDFTGKGTKSITIEMLKASISALAPHADHVPDAGQMVRCEAWEKCLEDCSCKKPHAMNGPHGDAPCPAVNSKCIPIPTTPQMVRCVNWAEVPRCFGCRRGQPHALLAISTLTCYRAVPVLAPQPDPLAEARRLLVELEWCMPSVTRTRVCPICSRPRYSGHAADCRLAAYLAAHPEPGKEVQP
jgi:hypothetical protein